MHPELPKLLEVQVKDRRLAELTEQRHALDSERKALDALLEQSRSEVAMAERHASDSARRRDEAEQKLENQRTQHERRRARLETERNPRVAAQLLADVELGRSIVAQEESEWLRVSEEATSRENAARASRERLATAEAAQGEARAELQGRVDALGEHVKVAAAEREASAQHLDKTVRMRYDRLRKSRNVDVLVPAQTGTCTACYTSIPRSRIGKLQAEGLLLDGCEMCGAIIYLAEAVT